MYSASQLIHYDIGQSGAEVLRSAPFVPVVQATDVRNRDDAAFGWCDRPRHGRIFIEGKMRAGPQIILDIGVQDTIVPRQYRGPRKNH